MTGVVAVATAALGATLKRPLSLFERGMYLDGQVPVAIVIPARIEGGIAEARLRQALARLQQKHPVLRSVVVAIDGRPWFEERHPAPPIPLRIVERDDDRRWERESECERGQLFDAGREPLIRATLVRGAELSELLLTCHHCVCDGVSVLTLLRELLLLCDDPERDIGRHEAMPEVDALLPEAVLGDGAIRRRLRWKTALFKLWVRTRRIGPAVGYGTVYTLRWQLPTDDYRALAQRCRQERVTVFNIVGLALMLSFRDTLGKGAIEQFSLPVDVRRFLPKLGADALFAMAPTIQLSPAIVKSFGGDEGEYWTVARGMRKDIDAKIGELGPQVHENLLGMERVHPLFDRLIAYSRSRRSGRGVTLSYLGKLDLAREYGDFRLKAVLSPTAALAPTPANLVTIVGDEEALDFALTSDDQSLPRAQADAIRDLTLQRLRMLARQGSPS